MRSLFVALSENRERDLEAWYILSHRNRWGGSYLDLFGSIRYNP